MDRAIAIERGENPPPLPEDPSRRHKPEKKGRKSLEELLGIDSDDDDDEEDGEETDIMFRLPGLIGTVKPVIRGHLLGQIKSGLLRQVTS